MCDAGEAIREFEQRLARLEEDEKMIAQRLEALIENTEQIIEFYHAVNGAFTVLHWIGKGARPIAWIAAATAGISGLIVAIKTGHRP